MTTVTIEVACPLCGGDDVSQVSSRLRDGMEARFEMRPYRCGACGLVFMHPLMDEPAERAFYQNEYRRLYHGCDYDLARFHAERLPDARRRVAALGEAGLLRGDVLDVGSSTGAFLALMGDAVQSRRGAEPDERQRAFAAAQGIATAAFVDDLDPALRFDLITAFHVLEHVRKPVAFLRRLAARLRRGGALVVEVPNVDDALLSVYRVPAFATFYWHPAHSYYFSCETLGRVATEAGLRVEICGVQRYGLANHLKWLSAGGPGGNGELISAETDAAYARDLCRAFRCDTLWMIARPAADS